MNKQDNKPPDEQEISTGIGEEFEQIARVRNLTMQANAEITRYVNVCAGDTVLAQNDKHVQSVLDQLALSLMEIKQ